MTSLLRRLLLPAALISFALPGVASTRPGDLDPAFQGAGWTSVPLASGGVESMTVQNDGKILVTGIVQLGLIHHVALWRFLPDGSPDTGFQGTGSVISSTAQEHSGGRAVAVMSDGRIVVAGNAWEGTTSYLALLRYRPDGSLDTTFGEGGTVSTPMSPDWLTGVLRTRSMTVQPDGKILVTSDPGGIFRYLADGAPDSGFSFSESLTGLSAGGGYALALQSDGRILAGGSGAGFRVLRLNPHGTPDTTFGDLGRSPALISKTAPVVRSIAVQGDGRIVLGGDYQFQNNRRFVIARLLPEGSPDLTFNGTGWNECGPFQPSGSDDVTTVLVQSDGSILLAGKSIVRVTGNFDLAIARFQAGGKLDAVFGTGGKVLSDFGGAHDTLRAAALQADGRFVMAAWSYPVITQPGGDLLLARYQTAPRSGIYVEQPAGNPLLPAAAAALDFGLVAIGSRSKEFIIRNTGTEPLTGISVSLTNESHPGEFISSSLPSALAPGAQTSLVITFTPAAGVTGVRHASVNIVSSDAEYSPFTIPLTGNRATAAEIWRITWFGSPDNSGTGADFNDFDHDGIVNLLEFAAGSHPHQPSPPIGEVVKKTDTVEFTFSRAKAAVAEFVFEIETAGHPAGPWPTDGFPAEILTDNGVVQTIKVTISTPANSAARFVRLRVTRR